MTWYIGTMGRKWIKLPSAHRTKAKSKEGARRAAAAYYTRNNEERKDLIFIARGTAAEHGGTRIAMEEIKDRTWRTVAEHIKHEREQRG
jgi:hypothetical protein